MKGKLPLKLRELLAEVCAKQGRCLSSHLSESGGNVVAVIDREWMIDALIQELCSTGLREDDEPNARGLELEALIDLLGRLPERPPQ